MPARWSSDRNMGDIVTDQNDKGKHWTSWSRKRLKAYIIWRLTL